MSTESSLTIWLLENSHRLVPWDFLHNPCWPFPNISHLSMSSKVTLRIVSGSSLSTGVRSIDVYLLLCPGTVFQNGNLTCDPDFLYWGTLKPEVSQHSWQCSSFPADLPRMSQVSAACASGLLLCRVQSKSSHLLLQCLPAALWLEGGGKMLSYALYCKGIL